jgi:hypothetical protein
VRLLYALAWTLLLCPGALAGQRHSPDGQWTVGFGGGALRFSGGVRDTASPSATSATLRPGGRIEIWASLGRDFGSWEMALGLGWARGHAAASNSVISVEDRTSDVNLYRIAPWAGARLLRLGSGTIVLAAGPTFDRWTLQGEDRWRIGGEGRLLLRVPLGNVVWENRVSVGLSASPITRSDAGEDFVSGSVRVLSVGAGLRFGL